MIIFCNVFNKFTVLRKILSLSFNVLVIKDIHQLHLMKALMLQWNGCSAWNISGKLPNFDMFETFLCLILMKGTTIVEHILEAFLQCTNTMDVDLTKLISVTTDRDIEMIGMNKGIVVLLQKHVMNHQQMGKLIKFLCVVH